MWSISSATVQQSTLVDCVLKAEKTRRDGKFSQGSAVVVDWKDGTATLLTVLHLTGTSGSVRVLWPDTKTWSDANVVEWDADVDLAILEAPRATKPPAWTGVADRDPEVGSTVWQVGWSQGKQTATDGVVTKVEGGWIRANITTLGGDSGSALFDVNGQVVGIVSNGPTGRPDITYCCATGPIRRIFDRIRKRRGEVPRPGKGPGVEETPSGILAIQARLSKLEETLSNQAKAQAALASAIEELKQQKGIPGPRGLQGEAGAVGERGPQGPAGKVDESRITLIESRLSDLNNYKYRAILYDESGKQLQQVEFGVGVPLRLRLVPVK